MIQFQSENQNLQAFRHLFCFIDKTDCFQGSDENLNILHHPPDFKGPILFSFNAKNFFGKKKASIRIERGEWSDKFSLDVAGSCGVVVCKNNNAIYQVVYFFHEANGFSFNFLYFRSACTINLRITV